MFALFKWGSKRVTACYIMLPILNSVKIKLELCDLKGTFYLIQIYQMILLSINLIYMLQAEPFEKNNFDLL